jgi:hypothetical protein
MRSLIVKVIYAITLILSLEEIANAQIHTDPLVAAAVTLENSMLNGQLDEQKKQQSTIIGLNTGIYIQLDSIHKYEKIMYEYLSEAQGVIRNAYEIYRCGELSRSIYDNLKGCTEELVGHPQQAIISSLVSKQYGNVIEEATALTGYISGLVLKNGEQNLLTSGERQKVLWQITGRLSTINRQLWSLRLQIKYLKWSYVPREIVPQEYWTVKKSEIILSRIKQDIDRIGM